MNTFNVHSWGRESVVGEMFDQGEARFPFGLEASARTTAGAASGKAVGATVTAPFVARGGGDVRESQRLRVVGRPSLRLFQEGQATVLALRRNISNIGALGEGDLAFVQSWGETVLGHLRALSRGPYKTRDLRLMGHPYGWNQSWAKGNSKFVARRVPRRVAGLFGSQSIGHAKGVSGSVPTLAVINSQSGRLERSWRFEWKRDAGGFELRFINDAPYAWYLAHGTLRMQPHGPFTYSTLAHLRQLDSQIKSTIQRARHRARSQALIENMVGAAQLQNR